MKPFLSINMTENKKNEELNGNEFLIKKPSESAIKAYEDSCKEAQDTVSESKLPIVARIIRYLCGMFGGLFTAVSLGLWIKEGSAYLAEVYTNVYWAFWLAGGCLLIWGVLAVMSRKKQKQVMESDESAQTFSHVDTMVNNVFAELSVPNTAQEVDVLSFRYIIKDGNIKVREKGFQPVPYFNFPYKAYTDAENLYLVNFDGKYAFALSSLQSIKTVNKTIGAISWNKDELPDKSDYKQYKITVDNYGCIHFKTYHILELEHNYEKW